MKRYLSAYLLSFFLAIGSEVAYSQSVVHRAWVKGNQLVVSLQQAVDTEGDGFRLTGGVARIKALVSGSGSRRLTFLLTDYVLPDDRFTLLYWSDLGDAKVNSKPLRDWPNITVSNQSTRYEGLGTIYYVSTSGRDAFLGTDPDYPLRTIDQAQQLAQAGDYILLRRGDIFENTFISIKKSGQVNRYLTFGAYGQGKQPVIEHDWEDLITVSNQSYVHIDNLHLKVKGGGEKGIYLMGDCRHPIVSNCRIEGFGKPHFGINYGKNDGARQVVVYPQILNNQVSGFLWNIGSNGYPYDGTHEVLGGLIENNISGPTLDIENADGIGAQRGKFHGLVIRKNTIHSYFDDGIDLFASDSVVVEYNTVHTPQQPSQSGQGIKAGGMTRDDTVNEHQSSHIIVRYNTVHSLYNRVDAKGSHNGIQTNDGASGEVYGNLVYDVQGNGIVVSGPIKHWKVHHNLVINAEEAGLNVWTQGPHDHRVVIHHNVLHGKKYDLKVNTRTTHSAVFGQDNLFVKNRKAGTYRGQGDRQADISAIFVDPDNYNFQLNPTYLEYSGIYSPQE